MKLLVLDIETSPNLMHVWSLFQKGPLNHQMVIESSRMISFAAEWADSDEQFYGSLYHTGEQKMIQLAWNLLDEADAAITYNGKKFDGPIMNTEFLLSEMNPPAPYQHIDLWRVMKSRFMFPSGKLDFVAQQLGIGSKVKHAGYDLWKKCVLDNDPEAWELMKTYNQGDVSLTKELYFRVLPWIQKHPSYAALAEDGFACVNCGSTSIIKKGMGYTQSRVYQRYRCTDCGKPMRSNTTERNRSAKLTEVPSG